MAKYLIWIFYSKAAHFLLTIILEIAIVTSFCLLYEAITYKYMLQPSSFVNTSARPTQLKALTQKSSLCLWGKCLWSQKSRYLHMQGHDCSSLEMIRSAFDSIKGAFCYLEFRKAHQESQNCLTFEQKLLLGRNQAFTKSKLKQGVNYSQKQNIYSNFVNSHWNNESLFKPFVVLKIRTSIILTLYVSKSSKQIKNYLEI